MARWDCAIADAWTRKIRRHLDPRPTSARIDSFTKDVNGSARLSGSLELPSEPQAETLGLCIDLEFGDAKQASVPIEIDCRQGAAEGRWYWTAEIGNGLASQLDQGDFAAYVRARGRAQTTRVRCS